jgi:periplasmic protein TonB
MKRNDVIGMATSVALHAILLFSFTFLTAAQPEEAQLGFIEVEFGTFAEGRPVQRSVVETPDATRIQEEQPLQPEPEASPAEEARPVQLPEQRPDVVDPEQISAPDAETISPETRNNPAPVRSPEPQPETQPVRPLGSGAVDGTTGAESGADGEGADDQRSAPYQIEGLNRDAVFAPLPLYREQVNAVIRVRVTVSPQGHVVQRMPLLKGNPALEQAVMDALERWRFNPLPPNAPQEVQTGVVTFRFRLE